MGFIQLIVYALFGKNIKILGPANVLVKLFCSNVFNTKHPILVLGKKSESWFYIKYSIYDMFQPKMSNFAIILCYLAKTFLLFRNLDSTQKGDIQSMCCVQKQFTWYQMKVAYYNIRLWFTSNITCGLFSKNILRCT